MRNPNDYSRYVAIAYWVIAVLAFLYAHFILKLSDVI